MTNGDNHILEKGLPGNVDAERFILGSILLDGSRFTEVAGKLQAEDFGLEKHRRIFARMSGLHARNEIIDRVTLLNELMGSGELESVGGVSYLVSLDDGMPQIVNLDSYIRIVKQKANLRQVIFISQQAMDRSLTGVEDPGEIISGVTEHFRQISQGDNGSLGLADPAEIIESYPGGVNAFLDPSKREKGIATGFYRFDEMTGGLRAGELFILAARPAMGKAQPLESLVLMRDGSWKAMGSIRIGDCIASPDGSESIVTGVFPQGAKEIYRVTFSDGRQVECCNEHLWNVRHRKWQEGYRVLTTQQIVSLIQKPSYQQRLSIPVASGSFGAKIDLPIDPWLLGVLLGDGSLDNTPRLSNPDKDIQDRVSRVIPDDYWLTGSGIDFRISQKTTRGRNAIAAALGDMGLLKKESHEKFIPEPYLYADFESRIELLRGLLDTDGTVEPSGSVRFSTSSPNLANAVQALARSVGSLCKISSRSPKFTYNGELRSGRTAYVLTVRHPDPRSLFWVPSKRNKLPQSNQFSDCLRLTVKKIESVGVKIAQCISVSHAEGLYITDQYTVTHNTALALNMAYHVASKLALPVAVFSLEMSKESLLTRALCASSRVDSHRFRLGYLNSEERRRLSSYAFEMSQIPLLIDDTPGPNVMQIENKLRKLQAERGLGLVIVDYLQLMAGSKGRYENRNQEIGTLSRGFKLLARELKVPCMVLSQLSRAPDTRHGDHRPQLSDLRDSGSIEQDADLVGFIFREEVYKRDREDLRGVAELIIAKQRNGPIGKVDLVFLHHLTKFENRAEDMDA